jgi:fumarate hydratase subunit alpha
MFRCLSLIDNDLISETIVELLRRAAIFLPKNVKDALKEASIKEENDLANKQLETIIENISLAEKRGIPVCQDTGVPIFFIKLGCSYPKVNRLAEAIIKGTKKATKKIPLRENVIHPLTKENSGTNTGWNMPFMYYEPLEEDYVEVTALLKGFGSEAKTSLAYIPTSEDVEKGIIKFVLDKAKKALGEPCPPYIIGIGVGGTSDIASLLAKKAMLRLPLRKPNPDPEASKLEEKLFKAINRTGIGPMGLGGNVTALAVHMEICGTHTAAVPVAVAFQCWADRQASVRIYSNEKIEYL